MTRAPLDRQTLKALTRRSNRSGLLCLCLHAALLLALALGFLWLIDIGLWPAALPLLLLYGAVFSFLGYAGLGHELSHATVFSNKKFNEVLFGLASFLTWNNPAYFRLSHRIHHRFTLQKGVDYEVGPERSDVLTSSWKYLFFDWSSMIRAFRIFKSNVAGQVPGPFATRFARKGTAGFDQIVFASRIILLGHALLALIFVWTGFCAGFLLVTFAAFICTWPNRCLARLQHEGMASDADHFSLSCRTVLLPRWLSFLYWNMNYHVEHHMYPAVPFHQLPRLRSRIIDALPESAPDGLAECRRTLETAA